MTVYNLGSINVDHVYRLPHLPAPGETLAAETYALGLGGKGANQSVAAARAGARVVHVGAIGRDHHWLRVRLADAGVSTEMIAELDMPTGLANIYVDPAGENTIVLHAGANRRLVPDMLERALRLARSGDTFLMQNETNLQREAAQRAHDGGLRVVYSAAPFDADAVRAVLAHVTMLVVNEVEAAQLARALGRAVDALPVADLVVTRGARGACWYSAGTEPIEQPAYRVDAVDTTGAGDCFLGALVACLDRGEGKVAAMRFAAAAAALQVTREGAAAAMPERAEVARFLAARR